MTVYQRYAGDGVELRRNESHAFRRCEADIDEIIAKRRDDPRYTAICEHLMRAKIELLSAMARLQLVRDSQSEKR